MEYEKNIRADLTERQNKILTLYLRGLNTGEIIKKIKVSRTTIYVELRRIREIAKKEMKGYKTSQAYLKNKAIAVERRLY